MLTTTLLLRLTDDGGIQAEVLVKVRVNADYRLQDKLPWGNERPPSFLGFKQTVRNTPVIIFTVNNSRVSNPSLTVDFHGLYYVGEGGTDQVNIVPLADSLAPQ